MIRRRLFLHLSEAQSTGHVRWQPAPEIAARWRCRNLTKNLTAYYKTPFFLSAFITVSTEKPKNANTLVLMRPKPSAGNFKSLAVIFIQW